MSTRPSVNVPSGHGESGSPETDPSISNASSSRTHKLFLLAGCYVIVTGAAFLRVHRQPYNQAIKTEQYETIFKGTTLAAILAGVSLSEGGRDSRSRKERNFLELIA